MFDNHCEILVPARFLHNLHSASLDDDYSNRYIAAVRDQLSRYACTSSRLARDPASFRLPLKYPVPVTPTFGDFHIEERLQRGKGPGLQPH